MLFFEDGFVKDVPGGILGFCHMSDLVRRDLHGRKVGQDLLHPTRNIAVTRDAQDQG